MPEDLEPMPPYLVEIHALVSKWSSLGVKVYGDGTRLVGHLPEKGIGAYLHRLFGPLSKDLIDVIEGNIGLALPPSLQYFYSHHNGCMLFDRSVFVFGLRRSYDRSDFDAMSCNPFDIVIPTITNMPKSPSRQGITISVYEDKSIVFIEPDGTVCRALGAVPNTMVSVWGSFGEWLLSECTRLEQFFGLRGTCALARIDTVPPYSIA